MSFYGNPGATIAAVGGFGKLAKPAGRQGRESLSVGGEAVGESPIKPQRREERREESEEASTQTN
jgi:hypothetical protein